ncbi:MAG: type II secretion system protein [Sulfurovaceae bacterium]
MQQIVTKKIRCKSSQAFTLIELLIVIFLISLLYGLAFGYFVNPEKKAGDILSLKEDILRASHDAKRLVCTNECSECFIVSHAGVIKYADSGLLEGAEVFYIDENERLENVVYDQKFQDQDICLEYDIHGNGSATQLIVKTNRGVYLLAAYPNKSQKFDSLEDAQKAWLLGVSETRSEGIR